MRKKLSERIHTKRRLQERYGLDLNRHELRKLVIQIQDATAEFLETQTNRISLWRVKHDEVSIDVVYDKKRGEIITALPFDCKRVISKSPKSTYL